jgi:hypothetical protein
VSAILKALKKLEQETAANAGAPLPGDAGNQSRKQTKSIIIPGLIVLILCILTGVGISIFARKSSAPESTTAFLKDKKPVSPVSIPADMIPQSRAAETDTQKQKKPAVAAPEFKFATADVVSAENQPKDLEKGLRESLEGHTYQMMADRPAAVHSTDPFLPITPAPDAQPDIQPDAADGNRPPIEENAQTEASLQADTSISEESIPALADKPFAAKPVARKAEPLVALIEDSDMQLQAISWSVDADKRMAIINGKICREKDRVGAYVIQSINTGDVILSKGSVKGKLVFKIR